MGSVVFIGTLIEPLLGLTLTLLLGPFSALENVILGASVLDSGQILLAITLVAWLARSITRREIRLPRSSSVVLLPLVCFICVAAVSLLKAPSMTDGLKEVAKWVQMGLVAWLVADTTEGRGKKRIAWTAAALVLAGLSQAFIGIWQFGFRGTGPEHFVILGRFYRAYGTFEQPNPYAGLMGLILPLAVGLALGLAIAKWKQENNSNTHPSILTLAALAVLAAASLILTTALVMSWSRGGWLGAAAGMFTMLYFLPHRRMRGVLLVLGLLLVGGVVLGSGLLPGAITDRLTGFTDYLELDDARGVDSTPANFAVLERMAHWQAALSMAKAHPWLGVGFGNYEAAYPDHALINWPYALGHAHNYYLNILGETGALGTAAYLAFWAAVIWATAGVIRQSRYPARGVAVGLMGIWAHLSTHHLVDNLYVNNVFLHLGALLGILILLRNLQDDAITD